MNLEEIEAVVRVLRESPRLTECEIRSGETVLRLRRAGDRVSVNAAADKSVQGVIGGGATNGKAAGDSPAVIRGASSVASPSQPVAAPSAQVTSHIVGVFRANRNAPAAVGEAVKKGQTLGQIEAMRLMNECVAPTGGRIQAILVHDGQPVEYGQVLFEIAANDDQQEDDE